MPTTRELSLRLLVIALATFLLTAASLEFYNITWGTGEWLGEFSLKWFVAFVLFEIFCIVCLQATILAAWRNEKFYASLARVAKLRNKLGVMRWALSAVVLILPVWILQYTAWGLVLHGQYLRWLLWAVSAILLGFLLTRSDERALEWLGALFVLTLILGGMVGVKVGKGVEVGVIEGVRVGVSVGMRVMVGPKVGVMLGSVVAVGAKGLASLRRLRALQPAKPHNKRTIKKIRNKKLLNRKGRKGKDKKKNKGAVL